MKAQAHTSLRIGLSIENEQSGKAEPEMPKAGDDPREKHAPKTLAHILESLVEEEFAQNRVPIVHQIAADAASRLLEQKSH